MNSTVLERYHSQDNYYSEGEGLSNSQWRGKFSEVQGLEGKIQKDDWLNACNGIDPEGNAIRRQQKGSRAGWDITLSASKSVSLKALIDQDEKVLEAHRKAVDATVKYIEENCIHAQIKRNGKVISEQTQQGHFALFEHDDNRNQEPQLHTHVVILNHTLCADGKSRTLDSRELFNHKKTIGAIYDHSLAYHLQQQGYELDWQSDHTFEIRGYEINQLEEFSTRRQQIRDYLAQRNISLEQATEAQKTIACLESRVEKVHKLSPIDHELQHEAWTRLANELNIQHPQPRENLEYLYQSATHPGSLNEVIYAALESATTYQVAVTQQQLLRECLRHSQGFYDPEKIIQALAESDDLIQTADQRLTTESILKREQFILKSANVGQNTCPVLAAADIVEAIAQEKNLNEGQTAGLKHLALNTDQVMLVQGDAGVGKTYTLKAFRDVLPEEAQEKIIGLAPSAVAAQVIQDEVGIVSKTVDSYLYQSTHNQDKNQVLIVDEAGMLSHQQMSQLLQKTQELSHRLILIGDTKQLSSIGAGAPFRLLQERSQLPTVNLTENLRQITPQLKEAVDLAARQQMKSALQVLDDHGAIREIKNEDDRLKAVAQTYLERPHERQVQTLILCDTNQERQAITEQIRAAYVEQGKLGQESIQVQSLQPKRLDKQGIQQAFNYQVGDVIRFRQSTPKFPSLYYRVTQVESDTLILQDQQGQELKLPLHQYKEREVFWSQELELRTGDRLRFTRNQRDWKQINGQMFTVEDFNADGTVQINSRGKSYAVPTEKMVHSDYAYCRTVYGAQGWTAKEAIWASGQKPGKEQTYVALSRAKEHLEIVTADRQALGLSAQQSQAQENALDLVQSQRPNHSSFQKSDAQLWQLYQEVKAWKKQPQPQPPKAGEEKILEAQFSQYRQRYQGLTLNVKRQEEELQALGKPRSLFNWKGPSSIELEARRQLIQEDKQRIQVVKASYQKTQQALTTWQEKQTAFDDWERSPETQRMQQAIEELNQSENLARLNKISEGQSWYRFTQKLLEQASKGEGAQRHLCGKVYSFETDGQSARIKRHGQTIFHASDERKQGGIIQTYKMMMTNQDKKTLKEAAEMIQSRLRQQRRSQGRGMSH